MYIGVESPSFPTESLPVRVRAFWFPAGERAATAIRVVKTTETGQVRMSPDAPWIPFTAEQEIDSGKVASVGKRGSIRAKSLP